MRPTLPLTLLPFLLLYFLTIPAYSFEDPTQGQPFLEWAWRDQIRPTIQVAGEKESLFMIGAGVGATLASRPFDDEVRAANRDNQKMSTELTDIGSFLGSGQPGILLAIGQILFDTDNGLLHARALTLTSATHISIALLSQRERPNGRGPYVSFPSGHTSSAFATATSLAYSYGWFVGVPALGIAGLVASSKWNDDVHWLSDTVAGAALGIFWARASALSGKYRPASTSTVSNLQWAPALVPGGGILVVGWEM